MLEIFARLDAQQQDALLDYAAMLVADGDSAPQPEPRPDEESVVLAIKRLTRSYPVPDRRRLMGPSMLNGRLKTGRSTSDNQHVEAFVIHG